MQNIIGKRWYILLIIILPIPVAILAIMWMNKRISLSNVAQLVKKHGDWLDYSTVAKLIYAQAKHETGNFTSNVFKQANNLFGMKPSSRGLHQGIYGAYAKYDNWEKSVIDMIAYLRARGGHENVQFMTPTEYAEWLKSKNYYEDTVANYSKGLNFFYA